uniref:Uncharacterized protein n=1 Tax=Callorhinchus milii TaxID=7868 RepID=A0A4W3GGP0_CALMI
MSRDMAWQNLTVPTAAIGAKPWRERAFKAIRLAEAIVDNSSRGFTMAPWRSSVMYEHQGRRLARMEGCDPVPGSYPESQESEAQHQARIEQAKYSLKPEEEVGKRCGGSNVLSSSGDVLYKVPEGHSEGWGFRMEMEMLPFLRDMTALNSNEQISIYAYQSRAVLMGLRTSINSINQEIQRLNQHRQQLLQILANVRKAIQLNHQTSKIRDWRPAGERDLDGVDLLIDLEKKQLLRLKPELEGPLHTVKQYLQTLDACRKQLEECFSERSRVVDLIPQRLTPFQSKAIVKDCLTVKKDETTTELKYKLPKATPLGPYTLGKPASQSLCVCVCVCQSLCVNV